MHKQRINRFIFPVICLIMAAILASCSLPSENQDDNSATRGNDRAERFLEIPVELNYSWETKDYITWQVYENSSGYTVYRLNTNTDEYEEILKIKGNHCNRYSIGQELNPESEIEPGNRTAVTSLNQLKSRYKIMPFRAFARDEFQIPVKLQNIDDEVLEKYFQVNGLHYEEDIFKGRITFYNTINDTLCAYTVDTDEYGKIDIHIEDLINNQIMGIRRFLPDLPEEFADDAVIDSILVYSVDENNLKNSHGTMFKAIEFDNEKFAHNGSLNFPLIIPVSRYLQTLADNHPVWPTPILGEGETTDTQSLIPTEDNLVAFLAEATGGPTSQRLMEIINLNDMDMPLDPTNSLLHHGYSFIIPTLDGYYTEEQAENLSDFINQHILSILPERNRPNIIEIGNGQTMDLSYGMILIQQMGNYGISLFNPPGFPNSYNSDWGKVGRARISTPDNPLESGSGLNQELTSIFGLYPVYNPNVQTCLGETGTNYFSDKTPADIRLISTETNIYFEELNDDNKIQKITDDNGETYFMIGYSKKPHLSDLYRE